MKNVTQRRYDRDIIFTCNHSYMRHQCMLLVRVCVVIVATCPYCWPPLNLEMQSCSHLIYTASFTRTLPQTLLSWNISTHVLMNQWLSHTISKITTLNMSRRQFFAGNTTENLKKKSHNSNRHLSGLDINNKKERFICVPCTSTMVSKQ